MIIMTIDQEEDDDDDDHDDDVDDEVMILLMINKTWLIEESKSVWHQQNWWAH